MTFQVIQPMHMHMYTHRRTRTRTHTRAHTRAHTHTHTRAHTRARARARAHTHTHTFNGPFPGATWVSRYQKSKTNLDFTEVRDSKWQWHQLCYMQICTSLQTDNHASTPPLGSFTGRMPFLLPNQ